MNIKHIQYSLVVALMTIFLMCMNANSSETDADLRLNKEREAEQTLFNACQENSFECSRYLRQYPDGMFAAEAKLMIETQKWEHALHLPCLETFERYLEAYPNGKFAAEAKQRIERLKWEYAVEMNYISLFEQYLQEYPNGIFIAEAREKMQQIQEKECSRTISEFLSSYTGHYYNVVVPAYKQYINKKFPDDDFFAKENLRKMLEASHEQDVLWQRCHAKNATSAEKERYMKITKKITEARQTTQYPYYKPEPARSWWEELIGNKYVQLFVILALLFQKLESDKNFKEATRSRKVIMVFIFIIFAVGLWWGIPIFWNKYVFR